MLYSFNGSHGPYVSQGDSSALLAWNTEAASKTAAIIVNRADAIVAANKVNK